MKFFRKKHLFRSRVRVILALVIIILMLVGGFGLRQQQAQAQDGGTLQYGEAKLGSVTTANGVIYQFEGSAGDAVEVELLGIGGFMPKVALFDPSNATVGQNENVNGTNVITLAVTLSTTGTHTIQVQGLGNADQASTTGQFTISLSGTPSADNGDGGSDTGTGPTGVSGSDGAVPIVGQVSPDNPEESYLIVLDPNETIKVTVRSLTPSFTPIVRLEDENGNIVALMSGQFLSGLTIELPPGNGELNLIVALGDFNGVGEYGVSVSEGVVDECILTTDLDPGVDMRSGGSNDHPVIGLLDQDVEVVAVGQNNGWYQIEGGSWIDGQLVTTQGLCAFLPETDYPEPDEPVVLETEEPGPDETEEPDGTPTATYTPSYTPTDGPSPTASNTQPGPTATRTNTPPASTATSPAPTTTYTPSYTPTLPATATYTPSYTPTTPAPQIAPPDANYNLDVPLDTTGSALDFVSYPDGDREDRLFYSVTGMNPNSSLSGGQAEQTFSVSCFGDNPDQVTFFNSGQTYHCGDTWSRNITADSDTGSILISAIGGQGTYVQWVVTMTATRTN